MHMQILWKWGYMSKYKRKDLENYVPYNPNYIENKYKMDANESPFCLDKNEKGEFIKWFSQNENLNLYPDTNSTELRETISVLHNVEAKNVICGVGSDEIIDCICKTFLEVSENVLIPIPTFEMYETFTRLNRGNPIKIELNTDFSLDENLVISKAKEYNAKLIFICSPNNPTGNVVSNDKIKKIASNVDSIVIIDEAYGEFSDTSIINEIENFDNIIVLKTFSKAYGLAGARVGYALTNNNLAIALNSVKSPYNLSTLSQKIATFVLKNSEEYKKRVQFLIEQRQYLFTELSKNANIKIYESSANFLYLESKIPIYDTLLNEGILVRRYKSEDVEKIRITVSKKYENELIVKIING